MESPARVLVAGASGRMGRAVRAALAERADLVLGAALESAGAPGLGAAIERGVVLTAEPAGALAACDVVVDFSLPAASLGLLRAAAAARVASVIGTTGFSREQRLEIEELARHVAVVLSPNFSVAVNVLMHLVGEATRLLGPGYDAEIVELHHAAKRDAPSGTALRLAEAVAGARGERLEERLVLSRQGDTGPRPRGAIGVQALRAGDCPGEHTVLLAGPGERLELVHRAMSREHFARGALRAAAWLRGRAPGLYGMDDVLGLSSARNA